MDLQKNIELVVFDFDGTLFHLDIDYEQLKGSLKLDGKKQKLGDYIQELTQIRHADLEKITAAELAAIGERHVGEEVVRTLQHISQRHKTAILTRNSRYAVMKSFRNTPLEADKSLLIVGREDVRNLKPHTEGLDLIELKFKVTPKETVMVGDTYHDVEVAKQNGASSIIVKNPHLQYLPEGADRYIDSLSELLKIL